MMNICDTKCCSGCGACACVCPKSAIQMLPDKNGFLYPVISQDICIKCNKCIHVCPNYHTVQLHQPIQIFAALTKNDSIRNSSSSGGLFSEFSNYILRKNGSVVGAAMDTRQHIKHISISTPNELSMLRGSKYVQSDVGSCYQKIELLLSQERHVLFSGTPCQVAGLKNYLHQDYSTLYTIDILCHGVPSPKLFEKFLNNLESEYSTKACNVDFRNKSLGWKSFNTKITFEDGTDTIDNSYYHLFISDICLRESCYHCPYASSSRVGDLTLGDFWAYKETKPEYIQDDDRGISYVSVNTSKGMKLFHAISHKLAIAPRTIHQASAGNPILLHPSTKNPRYNDFWEDVEQLDWRALCEKYSASSEPRQSIISAEDRNYYAIPYKRRHMRHLIHRWKCALLDRCSQRKG